MKPVLDRAGAPMIWVEALQGYLHWLPVTKLQFETFLCDQPRTRFDQKWYEALLDEKKKMNARIEPPLVAKDNYHRAFFTGIRPREVQDFIQWNNDDLHGYYYLLLDAEWMSAYAELQTRPAFPTLDHFSHLEINARLRTLLERTQAVAREITRGRAMRLSEQMFLSDGVMEWVERRDPTKPSCGGRGKPARELGAAATIDDVEPVSPFGMEDIPNKAYGFRLLRKDS